MAYFVSDIHLVNGNDEKATKFLQFLRSLGHSRECSHIFLLGDIFNLWLSDYSYFQKRYQLIIDEIKRLVSEKIIVCYFEGNHDLYLKKFWQKQLGVQIHSGPCLTQLGPWKVRMEHGDQMDPTDTSHIFLRWFLRNSVVKFIGKAFPERVLIKAGEKFADISRSYRSGYKSQASETAKRKMLAHGRHVFSETPFDILIAGHFHVHEDREVEINKKKFRLINLGSWMEKKKVFLLTEVEGRWLDLS